MSWKALVLSVERMAIVKDGYAVVLTENDVEKGSLFRETLSMQRSLVTGTRLNVLTENDQQKGSLFRKTV